MPESLLQEAMVFSNLASSGAARPSKDDAINYPFGVAREAFASLHAWSGPISPTFIPDNHPDTSMDAHQARGRPRGKGGYRLPLERALEIFEQYSRLEIVSTHVAVDVRREGC